MQLFSKIMKTFIYGFGALALSFSVASQAEPVMNLITLNTQDGAGYAKWLSGSAEALGKSNNAMSMGLCSPTAGAEQMGDHYLFSFFDSQKTAWSNSGQNPTMLKEVAKLKVNRTIKEWDNWRILRAAPSDSDIGYFWNIVVKTDNPGGYLVALDKLSAALKDNGHDVSMQVFMADTGRRAGQFMVSLGSPDSAAIGAAMDDRTEPWFNAVLSELEGERDYVHGFAMRCETYYNAAQ